MIGARYGLGLEPDEPGPHPRSGAQPPGWCETVDSGPGHMASGGAAAAAGAIADSRTGGLATREERLQDLTGGCGRSLLWRRVALDDDARGGSESMG